MKDSLGTDTELDVAARIPRRVEEGDEAPHAASQQADVSQSGVVRGQVDHAAQVGQPGGDGGMGHVPSALAAAPVVVAEYGDAVG